MAELGDVAAVAAVGVAIYFGWRELKKGDEAAYFDANPGDAPLPLPSPTPFTAPGPSEPYNIANLGINTTSRRSDVASPFLAGMLDRGELGNLGYSQNYEVEVHKEHGASWTPSQKTPSTTRASPIARAGQYLQKVGKAAVEPASVPWSIIAGATIAGAAVKGSKAATRVAPRLATAVAGRLAPAAAGAARFAGPVATGLTAGHLVNVGLEKSGAFKAVAKAASKAPVSRPVRDALTSTPLVAAGAVAAGAAGHGSVRGNVRQVAAATAATSGRLVAGGKKLGKRFFGR